MPTSQASSQDERLGGQIQTKVDEKWNARFKELLDYRSENGDCNVPQRLGKLGGWVMRQRHAYRTASLAQDRINRLSNIGFKWVLMDPNVPWETRFKELVRYKAEHGDCDVPAVRQGKLGIWVRTQRAAYMAGSLAQDRIDPLNSIGFDWTPPRGRRKALPSTREQSSLIHTRLPSLSTNVPSLSSGAREIVEHDGVKGQHDFVSHTAITCMPGVLTRNFLCHCKFHPANLITTYGRRVMTKLTRLEH